MNTSFYQIAHKGVGLLLVSLLSIFLSVGTASAQELQPEHLALARNYIDLTDQAQIFERAVLEVGVQTMQAIVRQNPAISEQTSDAVGRTIAGYVERKGELLDQFARVYAVQFTTEELKEIVAFQESEVGIKLSKAIPTINNDLGVVMSVFENNLRAEFFAAVRADLKEQGLEL